MTGFSMFMPLQDIAPGNSWLGGVSLKNYMKSKNEGNENKIIVECFHCTMDKMDSDGGSKTQPSEILLQLCPVNNHCGEWDRWSMENGESRFL